MAWTSSAHLTCQNRLSQTTIKTDVQVFKLVVPNAHYRVQVAFLQARVNRFRDAASISFYREGRSLYEIELFSPSWATGHLRLEKSADNSTALLPLLTPEYIPLLLHRARPITNKVADRMYTLSCMGNKRQHNLNSQCH